MRVTTTIRKQDRTERNDDTELIGPARIAFDHGVNLTGVSPVAGQIYINRYERLKDTSGKIIGIIYTGKPVSALVQAMSDAPRFVLLNAVFGLVLLVALLYFASRDLW